MRQKYPTRFKPNTTLSDKERQFISDLYNTDGKGSYGPWYDPKKAKNKAANMSDSELIEGYNKLMQDQKMQPWEQYQY